jgi:hypothetical protein
MLLPGLIISASMHTDTRTASACGQTRPHDTRPADTELRLDFSASGRMSVYMILIDAE